MEAPGSCARCGIKSFHDVILHFSLNQCWKMLLFEYLAAIRYTVGTIQGLTGEVPQHDDSSPTIVTHDRSLFGHFHHSTESQPVCFPKDELLSTRAAENTHSCSSSDTINVWAVLVLSEPTYRPVIRKVIYSSCLSISESIVLDQCIQRILYGMLKTEALLGGACFELWNCTCYNIVVLSLITRSKQVF